MNKNIIIALLTVLLILSVAFGFYQKTETGKFEALAMENEKMARGGGVINAEKQMKLAEQQALLGVMALEKLQVALQELKKK